MENQHRLIEGHRYLTEEEIALMNEAKELGAQIEDFIGRLHAHPDLDKRWLSIGRTDLQQGIMALVRGIARPAGF